MEVRLDRPAWTRIKGKLPSATQERKSSLGVKRKREMMTKTRSPVDSNCVLSIQENMHPERR